MSEPSRTAIISARKKSMTVMVCGLVTVDVHGFITQRTSSFSGKCLDCHAKFDGPIEQIVEHVKEHAEQEAVERLRAASKAGQK